MPKIGDIVTVHALTKKGRDRIRDHGNQWKVHTLPNPLDILLESVKTGYLKWVGEDIQIQID